jgi:hypothetical protein
MVTVLSLLVLSACSGYRSNPGDSGMGFGPPTASGGTYQRDGFYDGGAFDLDVSSPRPGESL